MKYKIILLLLLSICFSSCYNSPIKSDVKIKNIKVYYTPLFITVFGSSTESDMRTGKAFHVNNEDKIQRIKKELLKLKPIEDDFLEIDIRLVCDFYNNEGEKEYTLLWDCFNMKINDKVCKTNDKLIKLLTSN